MKKRRNIIGLFIFIIVGSVLGTEYFLDVNLLTQFFIDDNKAPEISIGDLPSQVLIDTNFVIDQSEISCDDNYDFFCEVTINGSVDTSTVGQYTITLTAIDSAKNTQTKTFTVDVVDTVDGSFYIPAGYYASIENLTGEPLKNALNDIITNHTEFPYTDDDTDVWDILREADEDPNNPDNVLTFYSGISLQKECQDTNTPPDFCTISIDGEMDTYEWNREHIWSKSRGDFSNSSDLGAYTDTHHLVAAERTMNSIKNNRMYEDCQDSDDTNVVDRGYGNYTCNDWSFEPRDEVKGDTARMIFYMAVRYEGEPGDLVDLEILVDAVKDQSSKLPYYGDLDDLLRWHQEDPVSEAEIERNQTIYQYQGNRNPFIDLPSLVSQIWTIED